MTEHQRKVLDWITAHLAETRISPSYHEIAVGCGLYSRSRAHALVKRLIAEGHLVQETGRQRTIKLADPVKRISSQQLRAELTRRGELYSPVIMAAIKRAGLEAYL